MMSSGGHEEMRESVRRNRHKEEYEMARLAGFNEVDVKRVPLSAHQSMMHVGESLTKISEHIISLTNEYERKLNEAQRKLAEYQGQGGTINMERSWKSKYRNALAEANQRLIDAGLDPVRIRKAETEECDGDCDE